MGEVYRARDAKLNRDVAIKVLPEAFAEDAERLARFQREAQVLASLNHPHIAAIYGLEKSGNVEALVLELVEGETLAERIAARAAADRRSARDRAPDRGRARGGAREGHRPPRPEARQREDHAGRQGQGARLRPRQGADGRRVVAGPDAFADADGRGDAGRRRPRDGGVHVARAGARPVRRQARGHLGVRRRAVRDAHGAQARSRARPSRTRSPRCCAPTSTGRRCRAETPASVRRVLRRCLDRDPKTRFRDVADARIEMDAAPEARCGLRADGPAPARRGPWLAALSRAPAARRRRLVDGAATPAGCRGGRCSLRRHAAGRRSAPLRRHADPRPVAGWKAAGVRRRTTKGGRSCRSARATASSRRPVAGTEGASAPFFSPDGQWIGFFAEGKLKKVPTEGGVAITLADAPNNRGGVWLADDAIVYAPDYTSGLMRISSRGGKPETLTSLDAARGERTHRWPTYASRQTAPCSSRSACSTARATTTMRASPSGSPRRGRRGSSTRAAAWPASRPRTISSSCDPKRLLALPIDATRLVAAGDPIALNDRVSGDPSSGIAYAAVAADGTFAYVPGSGPAACGRSS